MAMDFLKELFGSGEDLLQSAVFPQAPDRGGRQEGPLPLLPADDVPIQLSQHVVGPSKASRSVAATQPSQPANSRDHDIREVPFEMPMCLLAGDEGNEEEIMKLLESESPRLSPHKPQKNNIAQQNKDGENFIMPNSSSSLDPSDVAYKFRARKDKEVISKRDKKHSGGWPKGKSRRTSNDFALPKPPVTGYSLYFLENKEVAEKECETKSMPILSRRLGKMWSNLTAEQKSLYHGRAKVDRLRYLNELKDYLAEMYKDTNLEKALEFVGRSLSVEEDENVFSCCICQLTFSSLYNKQSHYSGKLHLHALIQAIDAVVQQDESLPVHSDEPDEQHNSAVVSSIESVATDYQNSSRERVLLQFKISRSLKTNAALRQQHGEAEYLKSRYCERLINLETKEKLIRKTMRTILRILYTSSCT